VTDPPWPIPDWLASVPTPRERGGAPIGEESRLALLVALDRGDPLGPIEARLDAASLREHAWALVEAWAAHGGDPRHRWVFAGLRVVSDDELHERLVPEQTPDAEATRAVLDRERRRLERALSTGRDWSVADWRHWLFDHPLIRPLLRGLVWAQRDAEGSTVTFTVDDADALCDVDGEPVALDLRERVFLVHPAELSTDERAAWGEHLAEHERLPSFAQLARPVRSVDPVDLEGATLRAFARRPTPTRVLRAALHRAGWRPGEPDERVRVRHFVKTFGGAALHAVLVVDPGIGRDAAEQTPTEAFFSRELPGGVTFEQAPRVPLREVSPVARSEVLHDLAALGDLESEG